MKVIATVVGDHNVESLSRHFRKYSLLANYVEIKEQFIDEEDTKTVFHFRGNGTDRYTLEAFSQWLLDSTSQLYESSKRSSGALIGFQPTMNVQQIEATE